LWSSPIKPKFKPIEGKTSSTLFILPIITKENSNIKGLPKNNSRPISSSIRVGNSNNKNNVLLTRPTKAL